MSLHAPVEAIAAHGCRGLLRRVEGPIARELFLWGRGAGPDAGSQSEAVHRALLEAAATAGASPGSIVAETVFLRRARADLVAIRSGRERALAAHGNPASPVALTEIVQPPLDAEASLEVMLHAIVPEGEPLGFAPLGSRASGARSELAGERRLHASGLGGEGSDAYAESLAMFERAEAVLREADLEFRDVARTWIQLRDIDADYDALNRARRHFFEARGIDPPPASTGIGGAPVEASQRVCLAIHAMRPVERRVMTTPTLNEAPQYGADFVRGLRVTEANKVSLHVSGTASVDEAGRTAHAGDVDAQTDRMLVNLRGLLEGQGAGFDDVVSAVTYLKHPADAPRLRARLRDAGFQGFPHALVEAPICRPDLLVETEALAVLALPTATP